MKRLLKDKRGEGFVDVCVLVLAIAMVLALVVRIAPVIRSSSLSFRIPSIALRINCGLTASASKNCKGVISK